MFKVRLRSSIVLMAVTIFLMVTGGDILFAGMAAISLIGMMELYRTLDFHKTLLAAVSYVAAVAYYALLRFGQEEYFLPFFIAYLVLLMAVYVLTFPKFEAAQVMNAFFGLFYVAIMISYIYQTRMVESGAYLVWLIFICSWGCDTMAYCTGMLIGKHKMAPILSPKKSIEGAVGGVRRGDADRRNLHADLSESHYDLSESGCQCGAPFRSGCADFHDRRSGGIRDQEKS